MHMVLWYSLYVTAWAQADPPLWALDWIEQLKPTFGALDTAARLSAHPFPAQVMILYAFLSTPLLGLYWVYYCFLVQHTAQDMRRGLCDQWGPTGFPFTMRLKFATGGVATLSCCWYIFPVQTLMGGLLVQRAPQWVVASSYAFPVNPVDHLVSVLVGSDGFGLGVWSSVHVYVKRSSSTSHFRKGVAMASMTTVELVISRSESGSLRPQPFQACLLYLLPWSLGSECFCSYEAETKTICPA